MNFLFNTVYYKPAKAGGGPIYSVSSLAEELVRRNHKVTVVASDLDIPGRIDVCLGTDHYISGVRVRYFKAERSVLQKTGIPFFSKSGVFSVGPEFNRWLQQEIETFDVVDSQIAFTCTNSPVSLAARRNKKGYFYHQRGNLDPDRLRRGKLKKMLYIAAVEKPVMRRADVLIALTKKEIDSYRRLGLTQRMHVIPNGIDTAPFEKTPLSVNAEVRHILTTLGDAPTVLWMSRIHPVKGPHIFVDSFIRLAQQHPTLRAVLAGPDEIGMLAEIISRVRSAGLADRFHYAGVLHGDDKAAVLHRADCFALPTEAEGFSMVLLEALAGKCAVVTTFGANFDEIESVGAGKVTSLDINEFTQGLHQVTSRGREGMREMGEKGYSLVSQSFSWRRIAGEYEALASETKRMGRK